jgi:hypothetical protein
MRGKQQFQLAIIATASAELLRCQRSVACLWRFQRYQHHSIRVLVLPKF